MCQDLLFRRYGAGHLDILAMQFEAALEIIVYAIKQENDDKLFQRWIHGYQEMSFDDFKDAIGANKEVIQDNKNVSDIFVDLKNVFG